MSGAGGGGASGAAGAGGAAAGGGVAAAGDAGGQGAADAQTNGHAQGGLDVAAIAETLAGLQGGQEELRAVLMGEAPPGEVDAAEGEGEQPLDLSFLDDEDGGDDGELPYGEDGEQAFDGEEPGDVAEAIAQSMDGYMAAHMQPLMEALAAQQQQLSDTQHQLADEQLQRQYNDLAREFPAMGDPEIVREVVETTRMVAAHAGLPPEAASHPTMLRQTFMALAAAEAAQQEEQQQEGPGDVAHLEGGGSSGGGGRRTGDAFDQMLGQKRGSQVLPWGGSS